MSARVLPAQHARPLTSRLSWLAPGLEFLALVGLMCTIFLLGYWHPIPLDWFSKSWRIGRQYQLVTVFDLRFQTLILYPSDLAAAATIALWLLARIAASLTRQERIPLRFGPRYVTLPLVGLAGLSALSATQAILPILSLEIAAHLLVLAALVIAIINLRPPLWAVVVPLALLLAIEGALSLAQVWAQSTLFGNFFFNWQVNAIASRPGSSIVQLPNGTRWLRAYGSFPHPNILGGFLCLAIPIVTCAYLRLPRRSRSAGGWLLLLTLALGLVALVLSFSRAAWAGIVIGALWAAANQFAARGLRPQRMLRRNLRPMLPGLLAIGLIIGLVVTLGPEIQSRFLLSGSPLEQRSLSERTTLLEAGAIFFTRHPWLGVGAGNMPLAELAYPPTHNIGQPVHNVPIAVAAETGLFGLLLWLIPPIGALWLAWRRRSALSSAGLAASAALIALLTVAQLDHYLWTQPTASLIWWLAVALAALWNAGNNAAGKAW